VDKLNEFHDLMFDILRKYSKYPAIGQLLTSVFIRFYDLNENDAEEVINYLSDVPDIVYFIIYYAVYRRDMFKEKGEFNSKRFEDILKNKIHNGNDELRRQIAWHFWKILDDRKDDFDKLKEYIDKYGSSPYSKEAFYFLFDIVEENIKDHYQECKNWFNNILERAIEYAKDPTKSRDLAFGTKLSDIIIEIAKVSADDYLETVQKISELALLDNVIMLDIKRIFESYKLTSHKERIKILPNLESLWEDLTRKNPMLIEIDWKG
jgi:hypothetical protein